MLKHLILLLVAMAALVSCTKEEFSDYPIIFTGEVSDIKASGAVFNLKLADPGKEPILEYGFVWNTNRRPTVTNGEKFVVRGSPAAGVVSMAIETTLQTGKTYFVRAYARNRHAVIYGKEVEFTSLGSFAPVVRSFTPETANLGDTILITGNNFSYNKANNAVLFNDVPATVIRASQDSLVVLVPAGLHVRTSKIAVAILGNKATAAETFSLVAPVIHHFQEKTGTFGSRVTITGENFLAHPASLRVFFDEMEATILEQQAQSLVVLVPPHLNKRETQVKVAMNNLAAVAQDNFRLASLVLQDFSPKVALTGNTITLTGANFSPVPANNKITFGGIEAVVTSASLNKLEVTLPLQTTASYNTRNVQIRAEVVGETALYQGTLLVNDKWFRLKNAPVSRNSQSPTYTGANCFTYNNKAYIGLHNKAEFWEYDPANDSWTRRSDFPGTPRSFGVGFVIENKLYFGTGSGSGQDLKDWWEYHFDSDRWTQKKDFAGEKRTGAVAFQLQNTGYVGAGFLWHVFYYHHGFTDFWRYTPATDTWAKAFDYPIGMWWGTAVVHANKAYIGLGNVNTYGYNFGTMHTYDAQSQALQNIPVFPVADVNNWATTFSLGDNLYIRTTTSGDFYVYSPGATSWTRFASGILTDVSGGIAFSIGQKAYVGLGRDNALWEYGSTR